MAVGAANFQGPDTGAYYAEIRFHRQTGFEDCFLDGISGGVDVGHVMAADLQRIFVSVQGPTRYIENISNA